MKKFRVWFIWVYILLGIVTYVTELIECKLATHPRIGSIACVPPALAAAGVWPLYWVGRV